MTPEGRVKAQVKKILAGYEDLWQHWAVQNGMGTPTLDCTGWYRGRAFAIETKAPGKEPTPRQIITIDKMEKAGGKVFVIDGEAGCEDLDLYLCRLKDSCAQLISCDAEPGRNHIHSRF
jgi:hypothetical protein